MMTAPATRGGFRRPLAGILRRGLWPAYTVGVLGVIVWADAHGHQSLVRVALATGTLVGAALLEQTLPLCREAGIRGDRLVGRDLVHLLLSGLGEAASVALFLVPAALLAPALSAAIGFSLWPDSWPYPVQCLLALLVADFLDYWTHRASHRSRWLWPIHAVHHDVGRLHVVKGGRAHFLYNAVRFGGVYVPLLLAGAPVEMLFWFQAILISVGSIAHGNLDLRLPAVTHLLLVTPQIHRVHHSSAPEHLDKNFAAVTPIWDRLFGTFARPPDDMKTVPIGVAGGGVPDGLWRQLLWPFTVWARLLSRRPGPERPEEPAA